MKVGLLTLEQKEEIAGKEFAPDSFFNPIQDADANWIISTEEMEKCENPLYIWIKDLPLIDFKPIIIEEDNLNY